MGGACCFQAKENIMHALPIIALVVAIAAFVRARRGSSSSSSWACAGAGCHRGSCHGGRHGHRWHHGRHRGQRALLYNIFARLDLSPAQEKALRSEFFGLRDKLGELRGEGERSRADVAAALRADAFEDSALDAMFARHDDRLAQVRGEFATSLRRVHELLDPEQRDRLAELIGGDWRSWRGPYR
jgi:uncharacterized membrane protein